MKERETEGYGESTTKHRDGEIIKTVFAVCVQ